MIRVSSLLKTIKFNFARKLKHSIPSAAQTGIAQQGSPNSTAAAINKQSSAELAEQFQPLSSATVSAYKQKIKQKVIKQLSYEGQDPSPNKLVNRPNKGVVWGLGGQLILADRKVQLQGVQDNVEEICKFMELQLVKNIYVHDWKADEDPSVTRRRYSIIGSCYSARHCWKTAIQLKNALNKHIIHQSKNKKLDPIMAVMIGGKDEEWTMVQFKDFQISLMTEEQRQAVDLQWKWNNPVSEETVEKYVRDNRNRKSRKGQFKNFD